MMPRIVARLDVKGPRVVKGVSMQGERPVGDPHDLARSYYADGADELLYVDTYASLVGRNALAPIIGRACSDVFVPIVVAGGIRTMEDIRAALLAGADRVAVNTQAVRDPTFPMAAALAYGASTVVLLVDAVRSGTTWHALTEYGREDSGIDAIEWAYKLAPFVGEVCVTSVDRDGRMQGPDVGLVDALRDLPCPLTYGGGVRHAADADAVLYAGADAVAVGAALHFGRTTIGGIKDGLTTLGRRVRK